LLRFKSREWIGRSIRFLDLLNCNSLGLLITLVEVGRCGMVSVLGDLAIVHVDHAVGPLRREWPVRNHDRGYVLQIIIESAQQTFFSDGIQRRGTFIENQNSWALK
jgi:hypothetical protein